MLHPLPKNVYSLRLVTTLVAQPQALSAYEQRLDYESILSRSGRAVAARRQPERNAQTKNGRGARGEARGDEGRRGAKQVTAGNKS